MSGRSVVPLRSSFQSMKQNSLVPCLKKLLRSVSHHRLHFITTCRTKYFGSVSPASIYQKTWHKYLLFSRALLVFVVCEIFSKPFSNRALFVVYRTLLGLHGSKLLTLLFILFRWYIFNLTSHFHCKHFVSYRRSKRFIRS